MITEISARWEQGSFFHWVFPGASAEQRQPWDDKNILLGSGRDALRVLVEHGVKTRGWQRLLVPYYYCQDVVASLASTSIEIRFYENGPEDSPIDPAKTDFVPGDVLLRVNYFGLRTLPDTFDRPDCVEIIDDYSHDPWCSSAYYSDADWCVASLRKTLPLPDGAVLWSPCCHALPKQPPLTNEHKYISLEKLGAMVLKSEYLLGKPIPKDTYRRLAEASEDSMSHGCASAISDWAKAVLLSFPVQSWRDKRRENHAVLSQALKDTPGLKVLQPDDPNKSCPFSAVIVVDDSDKRDLIRSELIVRRIYPTIIWPLDEPVSCSIPEKYVDFSRRMFSVQCDGRYSSNEMSVIAEVINSAALAQPRSAKS